MTQRRDAKPMQIPPPVRLCAPGFCHMPVDGPPHEGGDRLTNGVPVVDLDLGQIAGRDLVLEVSDPGYLTKLISAAVVAQGRLAMYPPRPAA